MNLYIDGMSVVMRPATVATSFDGSPVTPIEAAQIGMQMARRWAKQLEATVAIWAFDHPDANWRELMYPAYKEHRTLDTTPFGAAMRQLIPPHCPVYCVAGYEADDLIATLVKGTKEPVAILTGDSDYFQLVSELVTVYQPTGKGLLKEWTPDAVCERFGLAAPEQYIDWKALVGDKSDGIPGVPGIGPKRAAKLLADHGSLMGCVQAGVLGAEAQNALLWQSLIRLRTDARLGD